MSLRIILISALLALVLMFSGFLCMQKPKVEENENLEIAPIVAIIAEQLLQAGISIGVNQVQEMMNSGTLLYQQPSAGATWISILSGSLVNWNGDLVSAYYHPSRTHSATTVGKLGEKRSVASAGQWAVSRQTRGLWGNKSYYNNL